jgi:signal transduction histidine kinase
MRRSPLLLPLLALILALSIAARLFVAEALHTADVAVARAAALHDDPVLQHLAKHLGSLQTGSWYLIAGQLLLLALLAWTFLQSGRRERALIAKDAEQSQELLERLSIATQAAGIHCWELDWKTYAITWDQSRLPESEARAASKRHFGAELGSDLFKWVHPEDQHAGSKAMSESLARGEDHVSFRYRIVLPDGAIRHVQAFARTYSDADGKPQRSLGVSWDVTAEVEAAAMVARNAANERAMLERLSVATHAAGLKCWEFDFRQNKVVWLEQGLEPQQTTPEGIAAAGKAMLDQLLPQDEDTAQVRMQQAIAQRQPIVSSRARRRDADGTLHHVQMYRHLFYDEHGEPVRSLGAMLDITESYQRQVELEALSIRFNIATRAARAGVWEYRVGREQLWWSETMFGIYGHAPFSFQPTLTAALAMIHPDDLPVAQAAWTEAVERSGQLQVQFRIIRLDGSVAHVDSVAVVVTDPDTQERRLVGIMLDISQRVEAEQRERLLQRQLREASHQAGMAEVATGVLHNVGNALNSLGIAYSTAQARLKDYQIERVARVAAMLEANRANLADFLINDDRGKQLPAYLSALGARLMADAQAVQREFDAVSGHIHYLRHIVQAQQSYATVGSAQDEVDVNDLLETALTLKSQELNGAEIIRDIGQLPPVQTDRYKLLQIIVNFIANACDAMAANKPHPARLTIHVHAVLGQLELMIEDSGIGIASELLPRVWEYGFTTKAHGHGFGLHSAAVAAQQLGGSVGAQSNGLGLGARFSVSIPICHHAATALSSPPPLVSASA